MPMKMTNHPEKFQAFLSTYVMDSFFDSYLRVGNLGGTIHNSMLPAGSPVQLNTSDTTMNLVFPGIKSYYGPNVPLDIHMKLLKMGEFAVTEAD